MLEARRASQIDFAPDDAPINSERLGFLSLAKDKGKRSWPRKLVDKIVFWYKNRYENAYKSEVSRMYLSPEQRV